MPIIGVDDANCSQQRVAVRSKVGIMSAFMRRRGMRFTLGAMTVGVVAFYIRLFWETRHGLVRRQTSADQVPDLHDAEAWPHISIIVPARNERRNIRRCVMSLLGQAYPNFDVIVVDDGSTDGTADILAEMQRGPGGQRLTTIGAGSLPQGWVGKPHAMAIGASVAKGEWLLFTDADTSHRPGALAFAVNQGLRRDADIVSLLTRQEIVDPANHIIMPIVVMGIASQYPASQVGDPSRATAIANGQFLLMRRTTYDAVGGYDSPELRASVVDDRDMAAAVKRRGGTIALLDGRDQVSVCMYRSFSEAWNGWSKNAYAGSRGGMPFFLLMTLALPLGTVLPFVIWLVGLVSRQRALLLAGSIQVATIMAYRWLLDEEMEQPRGWGWTHPIGGGIMTALLWNAIRRRLLGHGVEWSGRTYEAEQVHFDAPTPVQR